MLSGMRTYLPFRGNTWQSFWICRYERCTSSSVSPLAVPTETQLHSACAQVPLTDGKQLLVPPEYLRHLTSLANDKMQLNWARAERFRALFRQQFLAQGPPVAHFGIQKSVQGGAVAHEMPHPNGVSGDGSHTGPLVTAVAGEEAAGLRAGEVTHYNFLLKMNVHFVE